MALEESHSLCCAGAGIHVLPDKLNLHENVINQPSISTKIFNDPAKR